MHPRQPQRPHSRHSAAVSLHIVPFHFTTVPALQLPATNPIRLPRTSLSHPETCLLHSKASTAAFRGKPTDHHPRQRCCPRISSSVTSVPLATLPLLSADLTYPQKIPPSKAEWKTVTDHNCQSATAAFFSKAAIPNHTAAPALPQQAQHRRSTTSSFRFTSSLPLLFCHTSANTTVYHGLVFPPV